MSKITIHSKPKGHSDGEFVPQQRMVGRGMKGQIVGKGLNLSES